MISWDFVLLAAWWLWTLVKYSWPILIVALIGSYFGLRNRG